MKPIFYICVLFFIWALDTGVSLSAENMNAKTGDRVVSYLEDEARLAARKLWESLATLERNYMVSSLFNDHDTARDRNELLDHMSQLGASIQPYYGHAAGGYLTHLLKKDVSLSAGVIKAVKSGDTRKLDRAMRKRYANAFALARFLSRSGNQTKKELTEILYKHLDLTWGQIQAMLKKDAAGDLEFYEKDRAHMLMFSDVLMDGLVKEFPEKFTAAVSTQMSSR